MAKFQKSEEKRINLTFWGQEEEIVFRPIIEAYQKVHPKITITYTKQSLLNYRTRLQTQIRASQGPDVFLLHSSWIPMFWEDLSEAPPSVISLEEYKQTFYPLASETLISAGKIYALPLEIDGLAMYVNADILKAAGVAMPRFWTEFVEVAKKVTVRNTDGQIQTAGAALGTIPNIDFWPEILGLLFLQQPGGNLAQPASREGAEVLEFYTGFVMDPKNKTWDVNLPSSTEMFALGKLAFYFAPTSQTNVLKTLNPDLNFKIAPVPQLPGKMVSYGTFWAESVSATSSYQKEGWEFLKFLTSAESLQFLNQKRTETQTFEHLYPRQDLASLQVEDNFLGAFITQAPFYKSWYLNSNTADAGINEEMIGHYAQAVNGMLQGKDPLQLLQTTQAGIKQILEKYKVK